MTEKQMPEMPLAMQQIGILNLRTNDFMTQLNTVLKALMEENQALRKENAELKAGQKLGKS
jgi:hypothetical protein